MNAEARGKCLWSWSSRWLLSVQHVCWALSSGTQMSYLSSFPNICLTKIKLTDNVSFTSLSVLAHFLLQNGFSSVQATQLQTTQSVEGKCFPRFFRFGFGVFSQC